MGWTTVEGRSWGQGESARLISDRLLRVTAIVAVGAALVVTVGALVNHFALDDEFVDLDAGLEISANNWITVVATFVAAVAAAAHALIFGARRIRFTIVAASLALLSLDDLTRLHERFGDRIGLDHIETAIFAPVFGAVFVIVWALASVAPARLGRYLRFGLLLLLAAVAVDLGSGLTTDLRAEGTGWPQAIRVAVEEGLEVAGWTLVAGALVTFLCLALVALGRGEGRAPGGVGHRHAPEDDQATGGADPAPTDAGVTPPAPSSGRSRRQ